MDYNDPRDLAERAILCGKIIIWMAVAVIILTFVGVIDYINNDPATQRNIQKALEERSSEEP